MLARLLLKFLVFFSVIAPIVTSVFKCCATFLFNSINSVVFLLSTVMSMAVVLLVITSPAVVLLFVVE